MPELRRVEQPGRDDRARAVAPARGPRDSRASPWPRPPAWPRSPTWTCRACRLGIDELDRVLGGGLVPGSLVLVGGEPGIGKSTLLLQAAAGPDASGARRRRRALRDRRGVAGPGPTARRTARTADRSSRANGSGSWRSTTSGGSSRSRAPSDPALVIVDSIQTATLDELEGAAGSVGQVRESALRLMELAKGDGIAVILVGHVTKDGSIAGPKTLEHLVDAVDQPRRASATRHCACCAPPRTASGRPTRSASSRWRTAAWSRWPIPRARSCTATRVPRPEASSRRRSRGAGRSSSRSRP